MSQRLSPETHSYHCPIWRLCLKSMLKTCTLGDAPRSVPLPPLASTALKWTPNLSPTRTSLLVCACKFHPIASRRQLLLRLCFDCFQLNAGRWQKYFSFMNLKLRARTVQPQLSRITALSRDSRNMIDHKIPSKIQANFLKFDVWK